MMQIFTLEQSEQWDKIVKSFKEYDVYWLSGYVKVFFLHGDGQPHLFYYENGDTRGINVVMKRDIASDPYFENKLPRGEFFDFITPYGYGGWIIEGANTADLFNAYSEWIEQNDIISEFVRFHPMIKNHTACESYYDVVKLGQVVHMDLSADDLIWENITSKNRNVIRKAQKNDVKIYNGRFPEIYKIFREIYDRTMDHDSADKYYYFNDDFYNSLLEDLPFNAQIFYAVKDKEVISAAVILTANGRMNYHLSGSRREYGNLAATNLLLYKAALWGCANGCKTFYLGGGVGSQEDSLFKFKRAFYKGDLNHFYIGKKIHNKEKYEKLMKLRGISSAGFFPEYRAQEVDS